MIRHIIRKDWILLWPLLFLVTAIQFGLEWATFSISRVNSSPVANELIRPLTLAWFLGVAAVTVAAVYQDAIPGAEQDWLIRPLKRTDILLAKILFIAATVCVPMFAFNLSHALAIGFPLAGAAGDLLYKELLVFLFLIVPLLALAATTRNMTELVLMGAALVVVYAASAAASAFLPDAHRCPTCGTGLSWMQHLLQHLGLLAGACVILAIQYRGRRSSLSRALALVGAICLVFVQLPFDLAFAVQSRLAGAPGAGAAVALEASPITAVPAGTGGARGAAAAREATKSLLRGDMDQAVDLIRRGRRPAAQMQLDVPVRVSGVGADELLLIDRLAVRLLGADGGERYRVARIDEPATSLRPPPAEAGAPSWSAPQTLRVPGSAFGTSPGQALRLVMNYSLTLMKVVEEHRLAVGEGPTRWANLGLCRADLDEDNVAVRCRQIGRAPFCYSATLHDADGRRNPEVLRCEPDYRPYLPSLPNVLSYSEVDLPVRDPYGLAHYEVGPPLDQAYVVLKVYGERDHFRRVVESAPFGDHGAAQRELP